MSSIRLTSSGRSPSRGRCTDTSWVSWPRRNTSTCDRHLGRRLERARAARGRGTHRGGQGRAGGRLPGAPGWRITDAGRISLSLLRVEPCAQSSCAPIPSTSPSHDSTPIASTRCPGTSTRGLPNCAAFAEREGHARRISQYLTPTELFMLEHGTDRLRADLAWHQRLLERLPELLADELDRKEP